MVTPFSIKTPYLHGIHLPLASMKGLPFVARSVSESVSTRAVLSLRDQLTRQTPQNSANSLRDTYVASEMSTHLPP